MAGVGSICTMGYFDIGHSVLVELRAKIYESSGDVPTDPPTSGYVSGTILSPDGFRFTKSNAIPGARCSATGRDDNWLAVWGKIHTPTSTEWVKEVLQFKGVCSNVTDCDADECLACGDNPEVQLDDGALELGGVVDSSCDCFFGNYTFWYLGNGTWRTSFAVSDACANAITPGAEGYTGSLELFCEDGVWKMTLEYGSCSRTETCQVFAEGTEFEAVFDGYYFKNCCAYPSGSEPTGPGQGAEIWAYATLGACPEG